MQRATSQRPPPTATRSELAQRTWFVIVCVSTCETPSIFLSFSRNSASGGWPASSHGPKVSSGTWSGLGLELGACGSQHCLSALCALFRENVRSKRSRAATVVASLKSRQPPHTARLTTAPSSALSLGRYSSTRSAISTRVAELALPADGHLCVCVCTDQAGRGAQQPSAVLGSAGEPFVLRPLQAALPPPSSFHLQRHSRATFSNCILPLATG